ncbi:HPP family protein [Halorussus salinus]|uniref:HPP family protein n=1 Tax=Halorussus salinus TaxID=1364935 RepID=UPI001091D6A9|nr:HPP family protein [Halorussus salinus]
MREEVAESIRESATAGALLVVVAALAVLTGRSFLFPSLGPSAFLLATRPAAPASSPRRVAGGHAVGILAGLAAYHGIASGPLLAASAPALTAPAPTLVAPPPALTASSVALAASGVVSVVLTTAGMVVADLRHAPACATTLIVSLGLLSSLADALLVGVAICVLLATHRALVSARVAPAPTVVEEPN